MNNALFHLAAALFLTLLLLAAQQFVQAMTPPDRPPIPRPSQEMDDLRIGERLVALTWIQSHVRDAAQRELLYELDQSRQQLLRRDAQSDVTKNIDRAYVNLLRMWAEV